MSRYIANKIVWIEASSSGYIYTAHDNKEII